MVPKVNVRYLVWVLASHGAQGMLGERCNYLSISKDEPFVFSVDAKVSVEAVEEGVRISFHGSTPDLRRPGEQVARHVLVPLDAAAATNLTPQVGAIPNMTSVNVWAFRSEEEAREKVRMLEFAALTKHMLLNSLWFGLPATAESTKRGEAIIASS